MKKLFRNLAIAVAIGTVCTSGAVAQQEERFNHENENDEPKEHHEKHHKPHNLFSPEDFGLHIGLNSFDQGKRMPDLDQWKSRYVALQWRKNHRLLTGRQMDVALGTGFEIAWNNYMLDEDLILVKEEGVSEFYLLDEPVEKTKLVVNNLNVPVMLQFGFKESNFRFGVGAYGGVRINSYQSFKDFDGEKEKMKGDYNLRRFNYGLIAEAGRGDFRLFVKYEKLPLFNDNNPFNGNMVSFGFRL